MAGTGNSGPKTETLEQLRPTLIDRWVRYFAPSHLVDRPRDEQLRARLVVLVTTMFLSLAVVLVIGHLLFGSGPSVLLVTAICLSTLGLLVTFRRVRSLETFAHICAGFWIALSIVATTLRGGLAAPATMVFAGGPVIAVFIGGRRPGMIWAIVAIAVINGILFLERHGVSFVDYVPVDGRPVISAVAAVLFTLVMLGAVVGLDAVNAAATQERDETNARLHRTELKRVEAEAEAKISRADRMASLGQLAAGVAHEVNNPLAYIVVNLGFIHEELSKLASDDDDLLGALEDAREGAMRVGRIVGALKTFTRQEDLDKPLVPVDVRRSMDAAIDVARPHTRHRGRVVRDYASDVPAVLGDAQQLTQVFLNLLINAVQAIPDSVETPLITARIRVRDHQVIAEVIDNGKGVAADELVRITEPFYSTKPIGEGTGLGLSVCEGIVGRHEGALEISSEVGSGTTVTVCLPIADDTEAVDEWTERASPVPGRSLHILLIDDDPRVARSICRMLPEHDIEVLSSGFEARERLVSSDGYDLVLCDLMLGDLSGVDLYEQLEESNPEIATRLVFITGGACTARAQRFIDTVANPVLVKPFTKERLLGIMLEVPKNAA